jgi:hypothetical protein
MSVPFLNIARHLIQFFSHINVAKNPSQGTLLIVSAVVYIKKMLFTG